jgi:predicted DNA-binding transcriptional regulator AlpA
MTGRMFLNSGEVAQLLDLSSGNAFLARRADLEEKGFPLPCAWSARPMKWRSEQVRAWIDRQGLPRAVGGKPQLVTQDYYLQRAASA